MKRPDHLQFTRFDETELLYDPRVHIGIYTRELASWSDHAVDWIFETYASDIRVIRRLTKTITWLMWHTVSGLRADDEQFFSVSIRALARDMNASKNTAREALDRLLLAGRFSSLRRSDRHPVMRVIAPDNMSRRNGPCAARFQPLAFWSVENEAPLGEMRSESPNCTDPSRPHAGSGNLKDVDPIESHRDPATGSTSRATGSASSTTGSGNHGNLDPFTPLTFFIETNNGDKTRMAAFRSAASWRVSTAGSSCAITVPELDADASPDDVINQVKKELANGRITLPLR